MVGGLKLCETIAYAARIKSTLGLCLKGKRF